MRKLLATFAFFLITVFFYQQPYITGAQDVTGPYQNLIGEIPAAVNTEKEQDIEITSSKLDKKAEILGKYLSKHNSPLQYHAQDFVDAAQKYGLDWKLVASIAGVESTFGKFIPGGFNGWGWGVYGDQALYFRSWKDAIYTVSKGLKEDYISRGLLDPYDMNKRYATSPVWGSKVSFFMKDLEKFAAQVESKPESITTTELTPNIAAISGSLAPLPYGTGLVLR